MAMVADANYASNCYNYGRKNDYGTYIWSAGWRKHEHHTSEFVWVAGNIGYEVEYQMAYTNWDVKQPDSKSLRERCINLWSGRGLKMNDLPCSYDICFICENRRYSPSP